MPNPMDSVRTPRDAINGEGPKPRSRQACEPCRRKKSKCPGERPVCSSCGRLGQNCLYARHTDDYRVQKMGSENPLAQYREGGRVERLEARFDQMLEVVDGLVSSLPVANRPVGIRSLVEQIRKEQPTEPMRYLEEIRNDNQRAKFHPTQSPTPPADVLSDLVYCYITNIDPLCLHLFDNNTLQAQIRQLPQDSPLFWSFLALTVRFTNHEFYQNCRDQAQAFYKDKAQTKLSAQAYTFSDVLQTLQSFCLLIFCDILDSRPMPALFNLGIAGRYALCMQIPTSSTTGLKGPKKDELSSCYWTLLVLDYTYGCSFNARLAILEENMPEKPRILLFLPTKNPDGTPQYEVQTAQTGMNTNVLQLISIWGHMMTDLKRNKGEVHEKAWHLRSNYRHITQLMLSFESVMDMSHRFQHVKLQECSVEQVAEDEQYWKSWAFMQILYHAIQAVLNHPLIHLLPEKGDEKRQRPFSFLQHNVDYAILHSSWVTRIVELCEEKNIEITDPFVGHLVAASATVHFFFCFAKDAEVVAKALEGFRVCHRLINSLKQRWPHLRHTDMKLSKLLQLLPKIGESNTGVSAPRPSEALFWSLLDYAASTSPTMEDLEDSNIVEFGLNTRFVPRPDTCTSPASRLTQETPRTIITLHEHDIDEFSPDLFDMPDMQVSMFADDFWIGGQL